MGATIKSATAAGDNQQWRCTQTPVKMAPTCDIYAGIPTLHIHRKDKQLSNGVSQGWHRNCTCSPALAACCS